MSTDVTSPPQPNHESLIAALEASRSELAKARDELHATVRSLAIDRALTEAGATNLIAARARLDESLSADPTRDPTADPASAAAALRTKEPALFAPRPRIAPGVSTSTPRARDGAAADLANTAASRAATGDRRALLDYMRLRRAV